MHHHNFARNTYAMLLLLAVTIVAGNGREKEPPVVIINDITDSVQSMEWKDGLELISVFLNRTVVTNFTDRVYLFSHGVLHKYSVHHSALHGVEVQPGDIVIMGSIDPAVEQKVRAASSLEEILKALPPGGRH